MSDVSTSFGSVREVKRRLSPWLPRLESNRLLSLKSGTRDGARNKTRKEQTGGSGGCRETFLPTTWPQTFGPIITLISSTGETYCPADASTADAALLLYDDDDDVTYDDGDARVCRRGDV